MAKTGLLILSNPNQIKNVLVSIKQKVQNTLYIQLLSSLSEPFGCFHTNVFNKWPKYSGTISNIYKQAATFCSDLDVRVLLSGLKYDNLKSLHTKTAIDVVIFDKIYEKKDIEAFLKHRVTNVISDYEIVTIGSKEHEKQILEPGDCDLDHVYKHTVLGGTFDRLHTAHKLLLTEALLRSNEQITIGVTEENMLENKILCELIEPTKQRIESVKTFLSEICPEIKANVVPINDPLGPTKDDPTMDLLIVSAETLKGGTKVNEVRVSKNLPPLDVLALDLLEEPSPRDNEELKISSSTQRMRILGTVINPIVQNVSIPRRPYVIGLTGGIASGKSSIAKRLHDLGAYTIDCDRVAHQLYEPGRPCHKLVVEAFGIKILQDDGQINRKTLGSIVFQDKNQLEKLNSLVWPAIAEKTQEIIHSCNKDIVVIEGAVLLTAGWQKFCHEVWSTFIPPNEAVKRLISRNSLSEEQAKARLASQQNNKFYIAASNIVFCSLWEVEYTRKQVQLAWNQLQQRLSEI